MRICLNVFIVMSMLLVLPACWPSSSSSSDNTAASESTTGSSDAAAEHPFTQVTPSHLKADLFGRGTYLRLTCHAILGATSYAFTTSLGHSAASATPDTLFKVVGDVPDDAFFQVYATNADGLNTRTARANIR